MIKEPTWTTWPKYKKYIDQTKVVEFVESIRKHKFGGQIEIDEKWEVSDVDNDHQKATNVPFQTCFGSHVFDPVKFSNISNIIKDFKNQGFRVTLWIHPFVNDDCENYSTIGKQNGKQ